MNNVSVHRLATVDDNSVYCVGSDKLLLKDEFLSFQVYFWALGVWLGEFSG